MKKEYLLRLVLVAGVLFVHLHLSHAAWVQKATFGGAARHRCTGFSVGTKGYIGGGHTNSGTLATFKDYWEYDPSTNSWTQIADFGGGYRYHSTAFSIGNYGYVGLGEDDAGNYKKDFWKYIPLINTWVQVAQFPGIERRGACGFVINDLAYIGTGQTELGYAVDFYSYNPTSNSWDTIAPFIGEARSSAVAFALNGQGYVGTGHIFGDDTNDLYQYDPITDVWIQKNPVTNLPRQDATAFVVGGNAYVGTGNNNEGTDNFDDMWKYEPISDSWVEVDDFDGQARRYMVSFTIGEVAYCGTGTNGTNLRDFWAYYPVLNTPELANALIQIFPNPASEIIYWSNVSTAQVYNVTLTDLSGKVILISQTNNNALDVEQVPAGFYLLQVSVENNLIVSKKIQVYR